LRLISQPINPPIIVGIAILKTSIMLLIDVSRFCACK